MKKLFLIICFALLISFGIYIYLLVFNPLHFTEVESMSSELHYNEKLIVVDVNEEGIEEVVKVLNEVEYEKATGFDYDYAPSDHLVIDDELFSFGNFDEQRDILFCKQGIYWLPAGTLTTLKEIVIENRIE